MTKKEQRLVGRIQSLVGRGIAAFLNDRDPERGKHVEEPLREAFDICLALLEKYPAATGDAGDDSN